MSGMKIILEENKIAIWVTLAILIVGSIFYFNADVPKTLGKVTNTMVDIPKNTLDAITKNNVDPTIYGNMEFKAVYTPEGMMKVFANADSSYLAELKTEEGNNIPGKFSMVLGFDEASVMKDEKLFSKVGDKFEDLFGLSISVGGILKKTDTPIDNMHFLSEKQYGKLIGEENTFFIKTNEMGEAEMWYKYDINNSKLNLKMQEGDMSNFKMHKMLGKDYYPLVLGIKEAEAMKKDGDFNEPGDIIKNEFGKNFIVIGVLEETGTIVDDIHFTNIGAEELQ